MQTLYATNDIPAPTTNVAAFGFSSDPQYGRAQDPSGIMVWYDTNILKYTVNSTDASDSAQYSWPLQNNSGEFWISHPVASSPTLYSRPDSASNWTSHEAPGGLNALIPIPPRQFREAIVIAGYPGLTSDGDFIEWLKPTGTLSSVYFVNRAYTPGVGGVNFALLHIGGYCNNGYYAGNNSFDNILYMDCEAICASESQCNFFYHTPNGKTCSRYNGATCPLVYLNYGRTYEKIVDTNSNTPFADADIAVAEFIVQCGPRSPPSLPSPPFPPGTPPSPPPSPPPSLSPSPPPPSLPNGSPLPPQPSSPPPRPPPTPLFPPPPPPTSPPPPTPLQPPPQQPSPSPPPSPPNLIPAFVPIVSVTAGFIICITLGIVGTLSYQTYYTGDMEQSTLIPQTRHDIAKIQEISRPTHKRSFRRDVID
ncbi:putative membrane protein [Emiliania huxleyi virus 164]|nr:putative membrane protein [Emiliania huxleyi virus 164]